MDPADFGGACVTLRRCDISSAEEVCLSEDSRYWAHLLISRAFH